MFLFVTSFYHLYSSKTGHIDIWQITSLTILNSLTAAGIDSGSYSVSLYLSLQSFSVISFIIYDAVDALPLGLWHLGAWRQD